MLKRYQFVLSNILCPMNLNTLYLNASSIVLNFVTDFFVGHSFLPSCFLFFFMFVKDICRMCQCYFPRFTPINWYHYCFVFVLSLIGCYQISIIYYFMCPVSHALLFVSPCLVCHRLPEIIGYPLDTQLSLLSTFPFSPYGFLIYMSYCLAFTLMILTTVVHVLILTPTRLAILLINL